MGFARQVLGGFVLTSLVLLGCGRRQPTSERAPTTSSPSPVASATVAASAPEASWLPELELERLETARRQGEVFVNTTLVYAASHQHRHTWIRTEGGARVHLACEYLDHGVDFDPSDSLRWVLVSVVELQQAAGSIETYRPVHVWASSLADDAFCFHRRKQLSLRCRPHTIWVRPSHARLQFRRDGGVPAGGPWSAAADQAVVGDGCELASTSDREDDLGYYEEPNPQKTPHVFFAARREEATERVFFREENGLHGWRMWTAGSTWNLTPRSAYLRHRLER